MTTRPHASGSVHPELARAGSLLRSLTEALRAAAVELPAGCLDPDAVEARLAGGVPALTGEPLLTHASLLRHVTALTDALRNTDAEAVAAAIRLRLERAAGLEAAQLVQAALDASPEAFAALAPALEVDADALATMLDWGARPALRAAAAAIAPSIAAARWSRAYCPACGAAPTLSVVRGKEHERGLHCGRCGTGWAFDRVRCPACGERDHERLGYLHAAGEAEYRRAEVCESCHGYLKSVALLDSPGADRVLELDLETAGLDFLALEHGYMRAVARA
jgi:FdhE protein